MGITLEEKIDMYLQPQDETLGKDGTVTIRTSKRLLDSLGILAKNLSISRNQLIEDILDDGYSRALKTMKDTSQEVYKNMESSFEELLAKEKDEWDKDK